MRRLGPALAVALAAGLMTGLGWFVRVDDRVHDAGVRRAPAATVHPRVGLVLISGEDLRLHGPWPFSRSVYADLLERLVAGGARAVGFDVLLLTPSPDRPEGDARLVAAVAAARDRVVFPFEYEERRVVEGTGTIVDATLLHRPFPALAAVLRHTGYVNVPLAGANPDGVLRRVWLRRRLGTDDLVSFAVTVARLGGARIPEGADLAVAPRFRPGRAFDSVSVDEVLSGRLGDRFRDRLVLVGAAAPELADVKVTPLGARPGVELNADLVAGLLDGVFVRSSPPVAAGLVAVGLGLGGAGAALLLPPGPVGIGAFLLALVWIGAAVGAMALGGRALPVAGPVAAIVLCPLTVLLMARRETTLRQEETPSPGPPPQELMLAAQTAAASGDWEGALAAVQELAEAADPPPGAAVLRATALARLGESRLLELALPAVATASSAELSELARDLEEEGYLTAARDLLERVYLRDLGFEDVAARLTALRERAGRGELLLNVRGVRELLGSRFSRVRPLAEGGMGVLFSAEDATLGRRVAIKVLHPYLHKDEAALRRFLGEVRALRGLRHENVVRVYEVEMGKAPYYTMELVEGETLEAALARGPLDPETAWAVARGVAAGLAHAHGHGVVHRDVKPANILVGRDRSVRLIDFGVAKTAFTNGLTREGTAVGTMAWAAPEQLRGETVGPAADWYAFGLVLRLLGPPAGCAELADACTAPEAGDRPADVAERLEAAFSARSARPA